MVEDNDSISLSQLTNNTMIINVLFPVHVNTENIVEDKTIFFNWRNIQRVNEIEINIQKDSLWVDNKHGESKGINTDLIRKLFWNNYKNRGVGNVFQPLKQGCIVEREWGKIGDIEQGGDFQFEYWCHEKHANDNSNNKEEGDNDNKWYQKNSCTNKGIGKGEDQNLIENNDNLALCHINEEILSKVKRIEDDINNNVNQDEITNNDRIPKEGQKDKDYSTIQGEQIKRRCDIYIIESTHFYWSNSSKNNRNNHNKIVGFEQSGMGKDSNEINGRDIKEIDDDDNNNNNYLNEADKTGHQKNPNDNWSCPDNENSDNYEDDESYLLNICQNPKFKKKQSRAGQRQEDKDKSDIENETKNEQWNIKLKSINNIDELITEDNKNKNDISTNSKNSHNSTILKNYLQSKSPANLIGKRGIKGDWVKSQDSFNVIKSSYCWTYPIVDLYNAKTEQEEQRQQLNRTVLLYSEYNKIPWAWYSKLFTSHNINKLKTNLTTTNNLDNVDSRPSSALKKSVSSMSITAKNMNNIKLDSNSLQQEIINIMNDKINKDPEEKPKNKPKKLHHPIPFNPKIKVISTKPPKYSNKNIIYSILPKVDNASNISLSNINTERKATTSKTWQRLPYPMYQPEGLNKYNQRIYSSNLNHRLQKLSNNKDKACWFQEKKILKSKSSNDCTKSNQVNRSKRGKCYEKHYGNWDQCPLCNKMQNECYNNHNNSDWNDNANNRKSKDKSSVKGEFYSKNTNSNNEIAVDNDNKYRKIKCNAKKLHLISPQEGRILNKKKIKSEAKEEDVYYTPCTHKNSFSFQGRNKTAKGLHKKGFYISQQNIAPDEYYPDFNWKPNGNCDNTLRNRHFNCFHVSSGNTNNNNNNNNNNNYWIKGNGGNCMWRGNEIETMQYPCIFKYFN